MIKGIRNSVASYPGHFIGETATYEARKHTHLCNIAAKVSHAQAYLLEREGGRPTDGEVETLAVPSHEKKS